MRGAERAPRQPSAVGSKLARRPTAGAPRAAAGRAGPPDPLGAEGRAAARTPRPAGSPVAGGRTLAAAA